MKCTSYPQAAHGFGVRRFCRRSSGGSRNVPTTANVGAQKDGHEAAINLRPVAGIGAEIVLTVDGGVVTYEAVPIARVGLRTTGRPRVSL